MERKSRKQNRDSEINVTAFQIVQKAITKYDTEPVKPQATGGKNPHAVALGRLGGLKGGKARAGKLTLERRKEIAQKAARSRWKRNA